MRSAPQRSDAGRAAWMILGLVAIPFLSVSSVALAVDVASTTDPAAALIGIPATFGGVLMGALVFRLGRFVQSGAVALRRARFRALVPAFGPGGIRSVCLSPVPVARPALVFVPASVGRRGPPFSSR